MAIRKHADIFINLLILMLVAGLEELTMKDIRFMQSAFFLRNSDAEASTYFRQKIQLARKGHQTWRKINNIAHLYMGWKSKNKKNKEES
jgi:hypothetical protein